MKRGNKISCEYNGKQYSGTIENLIAGKQHPQSRIVVIALVGGGFRSLYEYKMQNLSVGG